MESDDQYIADLELKISQLVTESSRWRSLAIIALRKFEENEDLQGTMDLIEQESMLWHRT